MFKEKFLMIFCIFSVFCASLTSVYSYNSEIKTKNKQENYNNLSWEDFFVENEGEDNDKKYKKEDIIINGVIPECFNSLSYGSITSIKEQDDYSTCWAFANIAAMETSLVRNNNHSTDIDLSETQLAYFTYNRPSIIYKQTGDYFKPKKNKTVYNTGGNTLISMFSIASSFGMVTEDKMEYERFYEDSTYNDYYYLNTDYLVNDIYRIDMKEQDLIKEAIIEYGSVVSSFNNDKKYYNNKTHSYYQNKIKDTNHSVTIIGWDDNYSKDNFNKTPKNDGAWLIKNNYGRDWGQNGYGWVSYEDLSISNTMAECFKMSKNNNDYKYKYQYDGSISTYYLENVTAQSNIFKSLENETLTDISFFPYEKDLQHKISIYRNIKNEPTDGELILTFNTNTKYKGYYTIKLPEEIYLLKDENFSIVIESYTEKNNNSTVWIDCTDDWGDWFECKSTSLEGQSFVKFDNEWIDTSIEYDANCRIKAFTK